MRDFVERTKGTDFNKLGEASTGRFCALCRVNETPQGTVECETCILHGLDEHGNSFNCCFEYDLVVDAVFSSSIELGEVSEVLAAMDAMIRRLEQLEKDYDNQV